MAPVIEHSCGVIVYRRTGERIEYLLLYQHRSRTWSFPKGHVEPGETYRQTALREAEEEAGLKLTLREDFLSQVSYPLKNNGRKYVHLFLAPFSGEISIQPSEISSYRWVTREEALHLLPRVGYTYPMNQAERLAMLD